MEKFLFLLVECNFCHLNYFINSFTSNFIAVFSGNVVHINKGTTKSWLLFIILKKDEKREKEKVDARNKEEFTIKMQSKNWEKRQQILAM